MKFNPKLQADLARYIEYTIIVEGKKQVELLNGLGFEKVYAIHENSKPLRDRVEELSKLISKKEKVCILTDFDKRGKDLYFKIKTLCLEYGIKTDSTLRGLLLVGNVNHIEELAEFMKRAHSY